MEPSISWNWSGHARWCLANGCDSITAFGTTGEGASLGPLIHQGLTRINRHVVPVMREHLGIIAAIEARDARLAVERLAAHIADARNRALGLW